MCVCVFFFSCAPLVVSMFSKYLHHKLSFLTESSYPVKPSQVLHSHCVGHNPNASCMEYGGLPKEKKVFPQPNIGI